MRSFYMSTSRGSSDLEITRATVGVEVELQKIHFVLKNNKSISWSYGNDVLPIVEPTDNGIEVVQDNKTVPDFYSALKSLADEEKLTLSKESNCSHVFEFFTHPTEDPNHLDLQFEEIAELETDLIKYLFHIKSISPNQKWICVNDWIDNFYNKTHTNQIKASKDSKKMFILVDYSINRFQLEGQPIAREIQLRTEQYIQFNFVAALGKKMGTFFVNIFYANSKFKTLEKDLQETKKTKSLEDKSYKNPKLEREIKDIQQKITRLTTKRDILLQAESNAEKACHYIRFVYQKMALNEDQLKLHKLNENPVHRKLIKLEGLFFILATRILTETTFISRLNAASKNYYLFFLKTQPSELINCLSENDQALLHHMNSWSTKNKNKLFTYIAGSKSVLRKTYNKYSHSVTIYDVLNSALNWTNRIDCNLFPNGPTKSFATPKEPKNIRRQQSPLERVLFEYRGSKLLTLSETQEQAHIIHQKSAELCKTTYLHKKELHDEKPENVTRAIMSSDKSTEEKMHFIDTIKLYRPELLNDLKIKHPNILEDIETYQHPLGEKKYPSQLIDLNIKKAMRLIKNFSPQENSLKSALESLIAFDDKVDHQLNQIDQIYTLVIDSDEIPLDKKTSIKYILKDIYFEKLLSLCKLPVTSVDIEYLRYIESQFTLSQSHTYPRANKLIQFMIDFDAYYPDEIDQCDRYHDKRETLIARARYFELNEFEELLRPHYSRVLTLPSPRTPTRVLSHSVIFPTTPKSIITQELTYNTALSWGTLTPNQTGP